MPIVGVITFLFVGRIWAAPLQVPFRGLPKTDLSFTIGGENAVWTQDSVKGSTAHYTWQGYALDLSLERKGIQKLLRFSLRPPQSTKLAVDSYSVKIAMPLAGLHSVVVPNIQKIGAVLGYYHEHNKWPEIPLYRCLLPEGFEEEARANSDAPFILLSDNKGNNGISAGWAIAERTTQLKGSKDPDGYAITLARSEDIPFSGDKLEDTVIISTERESWFDVEREYAKTFDRINGRHHDPLPAWTSDPVFCTWYCYLEHTNQKLDLDAAKKCKELGIRTFLQDAGWDVKPGTWWGDLDNGGIGDFVPNKELFPDMAGMVKQMHDMGMKVELWSAPFWQARGTDIYKNRTKSWHLWREDGESYDLCPKYPGTRELFKENYSRIAKDYGVDGMWFDVMDSIPDKCFAKHEHLNETMGNAVVDCMAAAREGLRSVNPQAITEARINHANINTKRALDIVQCSDSPESYEMIRISNIHMRPWAYDVVLKNDPMIWPKNSNAATVGKFMATNVCNGVPGLSVDFLTATDEQCAITKAWLTFYQEHKKTLLKGKFKLFGYDYASPDMMLIGSREAIVYMKDARTSEVSLPKWIEKAVIINCTDSDYLNLSIKMAPGKRVVQSYKPDWTKAGLIDSVDTLVIPQGGAAIVEVQ